MGIWQKNRDSRFLDKKITVSTFEMESVYFSEIKIMETMASTKMDAISSPISLSAMELIDNFGVDRRGQEPRGFWRGIILMDGKVITNN